MEAAASAGGTPAGPSQIFKRCVNVRSVRLRWGLQASPWRPCTQIGGEETAVWVIERPEGYEVKLFRKTPMTVDGIFSEVRGLADLSVTLRFYTSCASVLGRATRPRSRLRSRAAASPPCCLAMRFCTVAPRERARVLSESVLRAVTQAMVLCQRCPGRGIEGRLGVRDGPHHVEVRAAFGNAFLARC